ncbi:MAG TPA: O-antigen ligase family protein, partial [Vicinamibacterales bacterium]|nr:O-antigen ligase family protein [Vicinamibacterales bacterium]
MLVALLLLPLAAFGGGDFHVAVPFSAACLVTFACVRPRIADGSSSGLDTALLVVVAVLIVQLVPLPAPVQRLLSPRAEDVTAAIAIAPPVHAGLRSLSIDPLASAWAALVAAAAIAVFWTARHVFETGGVRRVTRGLVATGLAASLVAIAQAATAGRSIYWMFPTDREGPLPFGPFVNRNHFATWAIMAAPLCFGYIAARSDAHRSSASASTRAHLVRLLDGRTLWLLGCGAMLVAALLLSLSRSGIVALGAASAVTLLATRSRPDASRYWWFVMAAAGAAVTAALVADVGALAERIAVAGTAIEGRLRIWRETLPIVRDFWLTGTGVGTYQRAMLLYQQSDRLWYFNQAHNHYLQLAAEGGVLLCAAALVATGAYVRQMRRRLSEDRTG